MGERREWRVEIVSEAEPKGWIPVSVINQAMSIQCMDQASGIKKYFGTLPNDSNDQDGLLSSTSAGRNGRAMSSFDTPSQQAADLLPKTLREAGNRNCEMLTSNLQDDVNTYGLPWEASKSSNGVDIWKSKVPGQSRMVWKIRFTAISNASLTQIINDFRIWEIRIKRDTTFGQGAVLKTFADTDEYDVDLCTTKQILTVSPRELLQLRCWRRFADNGGFLHSFGSVSPDVLPGLPGPSKVVRGVSHAGSGMRWTLLPESGNSERRKWRVEMVAEAEPKGWIPVSVINQAMSMQCMDQASGITKYFANLQNDSNAQVAST